MISLYTLGIKCMNIFLIVFFVILEGNFGVDAIWVFIVEVVL